MSLAPFEARIAHALPAEIRGERVLAAVSGGADSVALMRVLLVLKDHLSFEVTAAHLDHALRGADSERDAEWVAELCSRLQTPLVIERVEVDARARGSKRTIEEAAREARYEFLSHSASDAGCRFVAVAHTADDRAETVLHHILRGTGLPGLRGMPRNRLLHSRTFGQEPAETADNAPVQLIRPLLDVTRDEVERYLGQLGQDFRHDRTNDDERFTRNRIRHTLLPLLRDEFNPAVTAALLRLSQQAEEAHAAIADVAERLLQEALLEASAEVCRLDCSPLREAGRFLTRTAFALLWERVGWPRQGMGFDDWDRLAGLVEREGAATLPGGIDARSRGSLLILRSNG